MRVLPFAWAAGAAAIGGIASSVIGGNAADSAAQTQANAATSAAQIQANATDQASQTELDMFSQTQANEAPYLAAGNNALSALVSGTLGGEFNAAYPGGAPPSAPTAPNLTPISAETPFTLADYQQSPGYQFQLKQGTDAVLNNASRLGGVNSGNTLKALTQFGQGLANQDFQQGYNNYNNIYNTNVAATEANNSNALNTFNANLGTFNANNSNYWDQYNAYVNRQNQQFSQLQTIAGSGQNAAAGLGALGANVGNSVGSNIIQGANATAGGITSAANAGAAAQVASANALSSGINNATSGIGQNYLLYSLLNGGGAGGGGGGAYGTGGGGTFGAGDYYATND